MRGPETALARFEPEDWSAQFVERQRGKQLVQQVVNALLEGAIFGAESVGGNFKRDGRDANEKRVGIHPPGEPWFEVRLASEFVHEVAIVVEDGAIADYVRRAAACVKLRDDLRVKNPELAFESGGGVYREWRLARNFGDEFDVVAGFFQERADFVGEGGFSDSVGADQGESHFLWRATTIFF